MKITEPMDDEPDLKILSDNDILLLAQQVLRTRGLGYGNLITWNSIMPKT
jgi:hypothetical protein